MQDLIYKKGSLLSLLLLIGMLATTGGFTFAAVPAAITPNSLNTDNASWFWQNPQPQGNLLNGMECRTISAADHCLAVGLSATVISTTDGGLTWKGQNPPNTGLDLHDIACSTSDTSSCVIAADGGKLFRTLNSGTNWTDGVLSPVPTTTVEFVGVGCSASVTCYGVGSGGLIYKTGDTGSTWISQTSGITGRLNDIDCTGPTTCIAVGSSGAVRRTTNSGTNWNAPANFAVIGSTFLSSIDCSSITCYAVGADGKIFKSVDSGDNWTGPQNNNDTGGSPNPNSDLNRVNCLGTTTCYASGNGGTVIKTTDGLNWSQANSATQPNTNPNVGFSNPLFGLSCVSTSTCYGVGGNGAIAKTSNSGASNWTLLSSGNTSTIRSVSCPDVNVCYGGASSQRIFKTSDGGDNWNSTALTFSGASGNETFNGVSCSAGNNCYAATDGGHIVHTTDGTTGTNDDTAAGVIYRAISCPSGSVCMAVGATGKVRVTTSAPGDWLDAADTQTDNFTGVSCPAGTNSSNTICYLVSQQGRIFKTTDVGGNITLKFTHPGGKTFNAIDCPSPDICVAVGDTDTANPTDPVNIYKTLDGGATWEVQTTTLLGSLGISHPSIRAVSCVTSVTCYIAGDDGFSAFITDNFNKSGSPLRFRWQALSSGTSLDFTGLSCPAGCTVVGLNGIIMGNFYRVTTAADLLTTLPSVGAGQALVISASGSQALTSNLDLSSLSRANMVLGGPCGASGPILTLTYSGAGPELTLSRGITVVGLKFQYTGTGAAAIKSVAGGGPGGNSLKCVRVSA